MKVLMNLVKVFLILFLLFLFVKYFFIYKDVIFSINSKGELRGKIVYSVERHHIKVIDLPSGKCSTVYSVPERNNMHLEFVHSPYFSPDGSTIVFNQSDYLSYEKIYIMDADGLNPKLFLDLNGIAAFCPSWSPDGKTIAYVVEDNGKQGLYTIRIADRLITRISDMQPFKSQPTWSPDSKKIIFDSKYTQKKYLGNGIYEATNLGGAYIINVDTKSIERYIDSASEPALSPNGRMLAYNDKGRFCIINPEDPSASSYIFIPDSKIPFKMNEIIPIRWSPDGKYVVFCQKLWSRIAGIYVMPIDNPKKRIRIGTDKLAIIGMSWAR